MERGHPGPLDRREAVSEKMNQGRERVESHGGQATMMDAVRDRLSVVAQRDCTVLIWGETGVGKEVAARNIHADSGRAAYPFVPVDCTTLQDTLFESQLFGHTKGAFTGAERATLGFFRASDGGTLFLDEIGELPLGLQAKLLRVIQDRAVTPLGSTESVPVDVRIVAATNRDLSAQVKAGEFREDLYFRLNVVQIEVPPLRMRPEEVIPLAELFLEQQAEFYEESPKRLTTDAQDLMLAYPWPGNVRELVNAVEHVVALCSGRVIQPSDLPDAIRRHGAEARPTYVSVDGGAIPTLEEAEKSLVARALRATEGNKSQAARLLRIERRRLYRMVKRFSLEDIARSIK